MNIGIFAKTFLHQSLEAILDDVQQYGLKHIQFNMSCAGLPSLPDFIDPLTAKKIHHETHARNIHIAAVSGTFNMIHPNIEKRQLGLKRLNTLAAACNDIGTSVITLCTGTRDSNNMWKGHPANNDSTAWDDLLETMGHALQIAEEYQVVLAFEPEPANVVGSAEKGRKLLNEMKSDNLKVVMDAANLFQLDNINCMHETINKAFSLLSDHIVIAHAKDIKIDKKELKVVAAGQGILDYDLYLECLHTYNYKGPLILHSLEEDAVAGSIHFLQQKLMHYN